jgi:hypothetical protein
MHDQQTKHHYWNSFLHKFYEQVGVFLKYQSISQTKQWLFKTSQDGSIILNAQIIYLVESSNIYVMHGGYILLSHIGASKKPIQ